MIQATEMKEVKRFADFFRQLGFPMSFGKIFGYLIASKPPMRSFDQIRNDLNLSKGSVSSILKLMMEHGYVNYSFKATDRKRYFKIAMENWENGILGKINESNRFVQLLADVKTRFPKEEMEHLANIDRLIEIEILTQNAMRQVIINIKEGVKK